MEIARLLSRNAQILILDEPTAALSDVEIEKVKSVVRKLASEGRSIIYVTHRLGEVFEIADRITIFHNGRSFEPVEVKSLGIDELIQHLLGRRLEQMFPGRSETLGPIVLSVREVMAPGLARPVSLNFARANSRPAGQPGSGANGAVRAIEESSRPTAADRTTRGGLPTGLNSRRDQEGTLTVVTTETDGIFGLETLREFYSTALAHLNRRPPERPRRSRLQQSSPTFF